MFDNDLVPTRIMYDAILIPKNIKVVWNTLTPITRNGKILSKHTKKGFSITLLSLERECQIDKNEVSPLLAITLFISREKIDNYGEEWVARLLIESKRS